MYTVNQGVYHEARLQLLSHCAGSFKLRLLHLPEYHFTRLPNIHNRAARLVVLTPVSLHITPVLEQLYWLPIRQRIVFKV